MTPDHRRRPTSRCRPTRWDRVIFEGFGVLTQAGGLHARLPAAAERQQGRRSITSRSAGLLKGMVQ
jgi:hypothetical protein